MPSLAEECHMLPPYTVAGPCHHQRQGQSARPCTLASPVCRSAAGDHVFLTYGAHCNLTLLGGPPPVTAALHLAGVGVKALCGPGPALQHVLTWLLGVPVGCVSSTHRRASHQHPDVLLHLSCHLCLTAK